jgi:predicted O-linked N-acetylglucosamine transferase (SPINDLY family)
MAGWLRFILGGRPAQGLLQRYRSGERAEAIAEARAREPRDTEAALVLAVHAMDSGDLRHAARALDELAQRSAEDPEVWAELGRARALAGRRPAAREALMRALELQPRHAQARVELALIALAEHHLDEARELMLRLQLPGERAAQAWSGLAALERAQGRVDAALAALREAVRAAPRYAPAQADLGAQLKDLGQFDEAQQHLRAAIDADPALLAAGYNLAMLHTLRGRWSEAVPLLEAYVREHRKDADAQFWLGNARMGNGDALAARAAYREAMRLAPSHLQARWGWTMAQLPAVAGSEDERASGLRQFQAELANLDQWFAAHPHVAGWEAVGAQQPFYLAYLPGNHTTALGRYGKLCARLMEQGARRARLQLGAPRTRGDKLRVGIVSAHLHAHSVWHALLRGWLEHLDPRRFEVHLFHTGRLRDAQTDWAARRAASLRQGLGDWTAWAHAIDGAKLDVLVYPEIGMDALTVRLSALRLAPVQLAAWGHPLTSGMPTIDAYLSAEDFEPEAAAQDYTESLVALPRLGCAYVPYGTAPQPPALDDWGVGPQDALLVCAGTAFKYAPAEDALWVDIARRCSPCKLLFFRAEGDGTGARLEARLRGAFAAAGLAPDDHLRFVPWQSQAAFFGLLQRAHVFLDTVGFSGFNTAMQAIECGTPVVAWEGAHMRGRFASAILRRLGLGEWVASSHTAYAEAAQRLCRDAGTNAAVRAQIAQRRAGLYEDKGAVDALAAELERLVARR